MLLSFGSASFSRVCEASSSSRGEAPQGIWSRYLEYFGFSAPGCSALLVPSLVGPADHLRSPIARADEKRSGLAGVVVGFFLGVADRDSPGGLRGGRDGLVAQTVELLILGFLAFEQMPEGMCRNRSRNCCWGSARSQSLPPATGDLWLQFAAIPGHWS